MYEASSYIPVGAAIEGAGSGTSTSPAVSPTAPLSLSLDPVSASRVFGCLAVLGGFAESVRVGGWADVTSTLGVVSRVRVRGPRGLGCWFGWEPGDS